MLGLYYCILETVASVLLSCCDGRLLDLYCCVVNAGTVLMFAATPGFIWLLSGLPTIGFVLMCSQRWSCADVRCDACIYFVAFRRPLAVLLLLRRWRPPGVKLVLRC
ncbi:hypothetical protein MANES_05G175750v8 [Manihot esculenta]|uniref:Uncharacterized protein n=1 Tax=Manihot esculenta TaxID=3983 RepID=A0ACB7HRJ9_MANES|nr:hypothetical protein MANES_05G175750v8 [Manihot esculenta]